MTLPAELSERHRVAAQRFTEIVGQVSDWDAPHFRRRMAGQGRRRSPHELAAGHARRHGRAAAGGVR